MQYEVEEKKTALENVRNCVSFPMKVFFFLQD